MEIKRRVLAFEMLNLHIIILEILFCQIYLSYGCLETSMDAPISDFYIVQGRGVYHMCWTIKNPSNNQFYIKLDELNLSNDLSFQGNLTLKLEEEQGIRYLTYWSGTVLEKVKTTATSLQIDFTVLAASFPDGYNASFILHFQQKYMDCVYGDSFHCSGGICIYKSGVCDGMKDCEDGSDEVGCGILTIKGVADALDKEVTWIKSKRTSSWGWQEKTPRIISALYLAGYGRFDGTHLDEELMAKQTKLIASVAVSKNSLSSEFLSMLINGLLITCHNPRHFFGQNLIELLKEEIESSNNFKHPITYLSLCNANQSWPLNAEQDLDKILSINNSFYEFIKDYQAIAVMALSCYESQTMFFSHSKNANIKTKYENTLQRFKEMQLTDGSFGNFHTTSLITQALISSGQENATDWNANATIHYLMQQLKMPHDLLASYLVLPVLNAKSLSDISKINCSLNPKRKGYDSVTSEMSYYEGQTIRIQYSLYMGDKKDVIHTISLLAPVNSTAYDVMELAASKDYKFTFKSRNMYVYQIDEVTNDSEAGLFWFCYKGNANHSISRCVKNLDQIVMQDEEHLVMWYKKAIF